MACMMMKSYSGWPLFNIELCFCNHSYFRMSAAQMEDLLSIVGEDLRGPGTNYRASIEPKQKLAVAIR